MRLSHRGGGECKLRSAGPVALRPRRWLAWREQSSEVLPQHVRQPHWSRVAAKKKGGDFSKSSRMTRWRNDTVVLMSLLVATSMRHTLMWDFSFCLLWLILLFNCVFIYFLTVAMSTGLWGNNAPPGQGGAVEDSGSAGGSASRLAVAMLLAPRLVPIVLLPRMPNSPHQPQWITNSVFVI